MIANDKTTLVHLQLSFETSRKYEKIFCILELRLISIGITPLSRFFMSRRARLWLNAITVIQSLYV